MPCGGCQQRREQLAAAARAAATGDLKAAAVTTVEVARTFGQDAAALARSGAQRLAAAHARLKR